MEKDFEPDLFDPETGEPIRAAAEAAATAEEPNLFDPETGEPLSSAVNGNSSPVLFDPETGKPLSSAAGAGAPPDLFDPETGKPLGGAAGGDASPDLFDPETGRPLSAGVSPDLFDPETGKPLGGTQPAADRKGFKKPGKPVLIGAAAAVCVVALGAAAVSGGMFKSKKDIVADALTEIVTTADEGYLEQTFGMKDLYKNVTEGAMRMGVSAGSDELLGFYLPMEGSLALSRDPSSSALMLEAAAKAADMDLGTFSIYMDDKQIAAAAPILTDRVFTVNYTDDPVKQLNDSWLFESAYMEDEDVEFASSMISETNQILSGKQKRFDVKEIYDRYKKTTKAVETLKSSMEIKKAEPKLLTINGKEKKYKGYEVRIPSKAIAEFVKSAAKFVSTDKTLMENEFAYLTRVLTAGRMLDGYHYAEAKDWAEDNVDWMLDNIQSGSDEVEDMIKDYLDDIDLLLYVDKKGHAVYLEGGCRIDTLSLGAEMTFHGGARPTAGMEGEISVTERGERIRLKIDRKEEDTSKSFLSETSIRTTGDGVETKITASSEYEKKSGDFEWKLRASSGALQASINLEGAITDYKKGKSLEADIDSVNITAPFYNWSGDLGGHFFIEPLSGKLTAPKGTVFDVIRAEQSDWEDVGYEIQNEMRDIEDELDLY